MVHGISTCTCLEDISLPNQQAHMVRYNIDISNKTQILGYSRVGARMDL